MINEHLTMLSLEQGRSEMPAQPKKKAAKPKKAVAPKKATKPKASAKKGPALECAVCGYRVIVDQACGCVEEHTLICCGKPMGKKKA
jgi:hypothetical protein